MVACSHLRPTPPSARIALRSPASQTSPAWRANVSSTAAYQDTRLLRRAASASITITITTPFRNSPNMRIMRRRRTCPHGSMDSSTFPSGGTEEFFCGGFSAFTPLPGRTLTTQIYHSSDGLSDYFSDNHFPFVVPVLVISQSPPLGLVLCCRLGREPLLLLYSTLCCIPSVTLPQMNRNSAVCRCAAVNFTLSE